ncbi:hypothetical protein KKF70_00825 [bacterium]|nr:hypothetical protein [Candidatus Omnitrophota bacterium]MBU2527918.1 hypothetical protein [bacterium]MBU3929271.1 hypothetical protein [bacterium]MBU4122248.1 hypothetical protein [bacterium]
MDNVDGKNKDVDSHDAGSSRNETTESCCCGKTTASISSGLSAKTKKYIFVFVMLSAIGVAATALVKKNCAEKESKTTFDCGAESVVQIPCGSRCGK